MDKNIKLSEYNFSMGTLIDVQEKNEYLKNNIPGSINIPFNELIFNHSKYLNKNKTYFIICKGGHKSKRAANILRVYGYNTYNVIR